jgi:hypothetical protein
MKTVASSQTFVFYKKETLMESYVLSTALLLAKTMRYYALGT